MENIYSEIKFERLPKMRIAKYRVISKEPEDNVINYIAVSLKEI